MKIQSLTGTWQFCQSGTQEWLSATVPGGIHTDLLALGRIPDPFVGDNEKRVQWVAEADWEYRRSFVCSPDLLAEEKVFLICDGLDTLATVTLNGHILGQTDDMFIQYRWDVKPILLAQNESGKPTSNELKISFASPVRYCAEKQAARPLPGVSQAIAGGPHLRKAPCHFGWDWGPQLPPIGIWKDLRLEGYSKARLDQVHLRQKHENGNVTIEAQVSTESWSKTPLTIKVRVSSPDGKLMEGTAAFTVGESPIVKVPIDHPQLWWPNGYGEQPLYRVEVSVWQNGAAIDAPLDQRTYQMGLRTIELRQAADPWGKSFEFVVNGV